MDTSSQVVVVGAGLAGLAAARSLQARGIGVVVVEARERVGGRVWSTTLEGGVVAELGGEWIFEGYDRTRALARDLGLGLLDTGVDYGRRVGRGPRGAGLEVQDAFLGAARAGLEGMSREERAATTVGGFLDAVDGDDDARITLRARFEGTCAMDLDQVGLEVGSADRMLEPGGVGPSVRVGGGNQRLAEAMADDLPEVLLGCAVDAVEQGPEGVVVRAGTRRVTVAAAVIALPSTIAARLTFEPALPDELGTALRELPIGLASKLVLPTRGRPEPFAAQSAVVPAWAWAALGERGRPRACVTSFAGGPRAHEVLELREGRVGRWVDLVRTLAPGARLAGDPLLYVWADDPFALGAYSAWDNRSLDRTETLRRPVGSVAFAGEHTASDGWHGTIEGAIRSGERAAEEVAALLASAPSESRPPSAHRNEGYP